MFLSMLFPCPFILCIISCFIKSSRLKICSSALHRTLLAEKKKKKQLARGLEFQVLWDHPRLRCHKLSVDRDCNRYKVNNFYEQRCGLWICKIRIYLHTVLCLVSVRLFATPWSITHQAPLSVGVSRQEHWSGLPCPPPGDLLNPGMEPRSPTLLEDSLTSEPPGKPTSHPPPVWVITEHQLSSLHYVAASHQLWVYSCYRPRGAPLQALGWARGGGYRKWLTGEGMRVYTELIHSAV